MRPVVIVPTYNERENLTPLVSRLLAIEGLSILVVDDQSPDGTGAEAERLRSLHGDRIAVRHRTAARGLGRSYLDGMAAALASNATHICQMDADFSHDPDDIPRLIDATRDADLAIGSRYIPGGRLQNWPLRRRILSHFANAYVRAITRLPVADCTSGFRCWRRELLARLPLGEVVSEGYAFAVEMTWHAHRAHGRIAEVPIVFVERRMGTSKMSLRIMAESAVLPWRLVARPRRG